jgi:diguanylate cyclase
MSFARMSQKQMQAVLDQLQQAIFHHEQWFEDLHRTLICSQIPDERDLQEDAHRKCRFGQWLYGEGAELLVSHPGFAQLEAAHLFLHTYARQLLNAASAGEPRSVNDYQRLETSVKQMRLELLTTKRELDDALFNLDPLTGAKNRISMLTKLREQQNFVNRKINSTCIAMIDLDNFKKVNDTYGHSMGDQVLARFAGHAMSLMRPYDTFFRYGGEEFLFCAPNTNIREGTLMMERLREELAAIEISGQGCSPFTVTASFGLTLLAPDIPVEQSIERADKALYAAKAAGRNRTTIWEPSLI